MCFFRFNRFPDRLSLVDIDFEAFANFSIDFPNYVTFSLDILVTSIFISYEYLHTVDFACNKLGYIKHSIITGPN